MAYTRRQAEWKNYPDTTTPIRAEDLNAIEDGIVDAAGVADTALGLASTAASRAADAEASASSAATAATAAEASAASAAASAATLPDAAIASAISTPTTQTVSAGDARWSRGTNQPLTYIDPWVDVFDNGQNMWVTGQATLSITAAAGGAAGATSISVSDATGITAGVCLVTAPNTANAQVLRVASVAGSTLTFASPLAKAITSGQRLDFLWQNEAHLSTSSGAFGGMLHLARYIADRTPATATKITVLGNSWAYYMQGQGGAAYNALGAAYGITHPAATIVGAGVGGNRTDQLLARFDTDVPTDSTHVVLFEWVNDTYQGIPSARQAAQWEALVSKVRALGAVPVIVGPPPLSAYTSNAAKQHDWALAHLTRKFFPGGGDSGIAAASYVRRSHLTNIATGTGLGKITTGTDNVAYGDGALSTVTTGSSNIAIGSGALAANDVSSNSVAIGKDAAASLTGGSGVYIGTEAGYKPNNVVANASVSGAGQTFIGYQSGKGGTTTALYSMALGFKATTLGDGSFAIGTSSTGIGASANGTNLGVIGTAAHTVSIPGFLRVDRYQATVGTAGTAPALPAQPSVYLLVKTMVSGSETQYVVPAYKAS